MKNIMAISACLKRCSLAISYDNQLYEINENIDAAANLVWLADNFVKSKNIDLGNIDGIITTSGPGSFTGIRVAQSFAKGLALSLGLPAASASYFDIIESFHQAENFHDIGVVIKSEKNQIYYKTNEEMGVSDPMSVSSKMNGKIVLMGDAIEMIVPHLKNKIPNVIHITDFRDAKYLLNFPHYITRESRIHPLYITNTNYCSKSNFQS
ncbi:MAG: tRNA (adenosine(37)-N6)-threonylcarbamoyltransferase complex dimerization subunit type 1 TsaB [Holosporaceae bacterium]|jgi:tRNA threonylcarbamoyl adenosine modification protein YeaZ|nr:tRNA (adenosine(37)-N6)-threonylcarbamoyltransferase complex dimerization subunit type 1 TsaB [Holosporaceae bacterium]